MPVKLTRNNFYFKGHLYRVGEILPDAAKAYFAGLIAEGGAVEMASPSVVSVPEPVAAPVVTPEPEVKTPKAKKK